MMSISDLPWSKDQDLVDRINGMLKKCEENNKKLEKLDLISKNLDKRMDYLKKRYHIRSKSI